MQNKYVLKEKRKAKPEHSQSKQFIPYMTTYMLRMKAELMLYAWLWSHNDKWKSRGHQYIYTDHIMATSAMPTY